MPLACWVSQSKQWHSMHTGAGGWRKVLHCVHRWINSLPSLQPSQKNRVVADTGRRTLRLRLLGHGLGLRLTLCALAGRNLNTRNNSSPTFSSPVACCEK